MIYLNNSLLIAAAVGSLILTPFSGEGTYLFDDSFFDSFFKHQSYYSKMNFGMALYSKGNKVYVEAPFPGVNETDITWTLDKQVLTIKGERKNQENEDNESENKYYYFSTNCFNYQVVLPDGIDRDNPQTSFKNGLMTIVFNKKNEPQ